MMVSGTAQGRLLLSGRTTLNLLRFGSLQGHKASANDGRNTDASSWQWVTEGPPLSSRQRPAARRAALGVDVQYSAVMSEY